MMPMPLRLCGSTGRTGDSPPVPTLKVKNVFKCRLRVNKLTLLYEAIALEAMWLYRTLYRSPRGRFFFSRGKK